MVQKTDNMVQKGEIVLWGESDWDSHWISNVYISNCDFNMDEVEGTYWNAFPKRRKMEGFFIWLVEHGFVSEINYIEVTG